VNRKDRRAARSRGKGGPAGAQGMGAGTLDQNLFASAIAHFNAGRFDEAERLCRDVLMFNRGHFDALSMLGLIAARLNNLAGAAELFGRALAINDRSPECHFNLGQILRGQGRHREAFEHLAEATKLKPNYFAAHVALADMLTQQNEIDAARTHYERALVVEPRLAEARHGLANLLRQQGRLDEAAEAFRQVLALRPDFAEARNNLGVVLATQGRFDEAAEEYRRALAVKPDLIDVYRNLGRALMAVGRAEEAIAVVMRGLAIRETDEARAFFVQCAQALAAPPADEGFRTLVGRALAEGWGRSADLSALAAFLVMSSEPARTIVERVLAGPMEAISPDEIAALARNSLLLALLESAPVRNATLERFLTNVRSWFLRMAARTDTAAPENEPLLVLACALARQCSVNEYVFAQSDADIALTTELNQRIELALAANAPLAPIWLAALGSLVPLHALPQSAALSSRTWPAILNGILIQQLREPAIEREIAIPALTPIDDDVSIKVRRQYEEMPYPRWVKPSSIGSPTTLDAYLRAQFPSAPIRPLPNADGLAVLVAGCGTGQHAIETAQRFAGARVLAIDLSRTSLGYAARKTREAGLRNIEYMQADILKLGGLNARFGLIESSGVLHHLRDPAEGLQVLVALLQPGGILHLGLYSALARADIRAARAFIAERGYQGTAADIRRCRQELLACEDGTPLKNVTAYSDFFATGECRDLLFHVQEHQVTIPQIKSLLAENGLTFLGFSGAVGQAYRARFPDDAAMTDLDRWHAFETENPRAFINMYQFWVQKNQP
jgi:tetratricopeptide (TPR) repeat protein/SAM-dependent methyltransferase